MKCVRLPYSPQLLVDRVTHVLTEMALDNDGIGQLLFEAIAKKGQLVHPDDVAMMRCFLHLTRLFETELRMRYKERGYHGL